MIDGNLFYFLIRRENDLNKWMIEARQKGVRKVNEMKIKVRETSGDHQGYIEWIEKFDFGNLPVEDRGTTKNDEE